MIDAWMEQPYREFIIILTPTSHRLDCLQGPYPLVDNMCVQSITYLLMEAASMNSTTKVPVTWPAETFAQEIYLVKYFTRDFSCEIFHKRSLLWNFSQTPGEIFWNYFLTMMCSTICTMIKELWLFLSAQIKWNISHCMNDLSGR